VRIDWAQQPQGIAMVEAALIVEAARQALRPLIMVIASLSSDLTLGKAEKWMRRSRREVTRVWRHNCQMRKD